MKIGDTITVSREEAKALRKQGWMPRGDIVTMMYVGKPDASARSNISIAAEKGGAAFKSRHWGAEGHAFVARKLAEGRA